MVDTHVSGAWRAICGGSSPPIDIIKKITTFVANLLYSMWD